MLVENNACDRIVGGKQIIGTADADLQAARPSELGQAFRLLCLRWHLPGFGPWKGRLILTDDELQSFLDWSRNPHSFDQLDDDWKAWAKAVVGCAKVVVGGQGTIQRNDAVVYLCQIMQVFETLCKGITKDDLRGKFVSGLVVSGLPPETDGSFFFSRALQDAQSRGLIAYNDVGWGREEERFYRLTVAGEKLADSTTNTEPSETAQSVPNKTADESDLIVLWEAAQQVLPAGKSLLTALSVLYEAEDKCRGQGDKLSAKERHGLVAEVLRAAQTLETLSEEPRFTVIVHPALRDVAIDLLHVCEKTHGPSDVYIPFGGGLFDKDNLVANVNAALACLFSFARHRVTDIGLGRFATSKRDQSEICRLMDWLRHSVSELELMPSVGSHIARQARERLWHAGTRPEAGSITGREASSTTHEPAHTETGSDAGNAPSQGDNTAGLSPDDTYWSGWVFASIPGGNYQEGNVQAKNAALCQEFTGLDEHDLLTISNRWRMMATEFTKATKRTGHYHGYIKHDAEILRITDLLEVAVSQRRIEGVNRLRRCLRRPDDDHLHWALATLDELDAQLRVECCGRIATSVADSTQSAATTQQSESEKPVGASDTLPSDSTTSTNSTSQPTLTAGLATIIMGCKALQMLEEIRRLYPRVITDEEAGRLHHQLTEAIEFWLSHEGDSVKGCCEVYRRPTLEGLFSEEICAVLSVATMISTNPEQPELEKQVEQVFRQSQLMAAEPVQCVLKRLTEAQTFDCREVDLAASPDYADPQRALCLLGEYWGVLRLVVLAESRAMIYHVPHRLTPVLVNLRKRINGCFGRLGDIAGKDDARVAMGGFLACLLGGDNIELQAAEEYFNRQLAQVEVFLQEARLLIGRKTFAMTFAENAFLKVARQVTEEYQRNTESQVKAIDEWVNDPKFVAMQKARRMVAESNMTRQTIATESLNWPEVTTSNNERATRIESQTPNVQCVKSAESQGNADNSTYDPPLSHIDLAKKYGREPEATRKMLDRWRKKNGDGWHEVDNRKMNEPKYLYRLSAVRRLFEKKPSGGPSDERPAE